MYICPFSFNCIHKVLYLYKYFMTTISECFSTVSNECMLSHGKWLTFYILKCLLYTDDYLLFVHVLYMLLCDDRASCKTACGWWVILYKYVLIKKKKKKYWDSIPKHPFLPEASYGLRVLSLPASVCVCVCACVCMCVCVSVNHQFVRTITCHPLKLQSPNLDQKCKTPWLRSLLFLGFIDLDLQGQIELKSQNLPHFGLVSLSGRQVNTKWSEAFQIWTKNAP